MAKKRDCRKLLEERWSQRKFLCIGLDPQMHRLPRHLMETGRADRRDFPGDAPYTFNQEIVTATRDLVCAYSLNPASYAMLGDHALDTLAGTVAMIHHQAPDVPVLLDAKYGDTEEMNELLARYAFDLVHADAVTVHPYMGIDTLTPFLRRETKMTFVLCRAGSGGAKDMQHALVIADAFTLELEPLTEHIARTVKDLSSARTSNMGIVWGTTSSIGDEVTGIRSSLGDTAPVLIPYDHHVPSDDHLRVTVRNNLTERGDGVIVQIGNEIIHASSGKNFANAARNATIDFDTRVRGMIR